MSNEFKTGLNTKFTDVKLVKKGIRYRVKKIWNDFEMELNTELNDFKKRIKYRV